MPLKIKTNRISIRMGWVGPRDYYWRCWLIDFGWYGVMGFVRLFGFWITLNIKSKSGE